MYDGLERRQYPRFECRYQVSFKPKTQPQGYDYSQTRNMSKGGLLLVASEAFQQGTQLEMIVRIPFSPPTIVLTGEVKWLRKVPNALVYEIGVKFLEPNPLLNQFIDQRFH